jgi:hypothetical protein
MEHNWFSKVLISGPDLAGSCPAEHVPDEHGVEEAVVGGMHPGVPVLAAAQHLHQLARPNVQHAVCFCNHNPGARAGDPENV